MLQFIPFDDHWFDDAGPMPGLLVPYRAGMSRARGVSGLPVFQCEAVETFSNVMTSPSRTPSFDATPAFSSST